MASSNNTNHPNFYQEQYNNTFYYCDWEHPFIAFTTCFCPLCESEERIENLSDELDDVETFYEDMQKKYYELYALVKDSSPELLL